MLKQTVLGIISLYVGPSVCLAQTTKQPTYQIVLEEAVISDGKASGEDWDWDTPHPDCYVLVGVVSANSGKERIFRSKTKHDTYYPHWGQSIPAVQAGDVVYLSVVDRDAIEDDHVGETKFVLTSTMITRGFATLSFGQVDRFSLTLRPQ